VVAWASCVQVAVVFGPPRGVGVVEWVKFIPGSGFAVSLLFNGRPG
jgi:hypothetical protein